MRSSSFHRILFVISGLLIISACRQNPIIPEEYFHLGLYDTNGRELNEFQTSSMAESLSFSLSSSSDWVVKEHPSWISLSALDGVAGESDLEVSISSNPDPRDRSARIVFSAQRGSCSLLVTQEASLDLKILPYSADPAWSHAGGGTDSLIIRSSVPWTVDDASGWVDLSPRSGEAGETRVLLTSRPNTGSSYRESRLVFTIADDAHNTYLIRQFPDVFTRNVIRRIRVRNSLILHNQGTLFEKIYAILPLPHTDDYQQISSVVLPDNSSRHYCPDGHNQYVFSDLKGDALQTGGELMAYSFDVDIMNVFTDFNKIEILQEYDKTSAEYQLYTGVDSYKGRRLVDPEDPDIVNLSSELWRKSEGDLIAYARACYEWAARNITYDNPFTDLHPIDELMKERRGDCGNFSSVFVSLLRARGIPARHLVMISPLDGYHIRAEFYMSGYGWIPVDPTFRNSDPGRDYFGCFTGQYIVVSHGICTQVAFPTSDYTVSALQKYLCWAFSLNEGGSYRYEHKVTYKDLGLHQN